MYITQMEMIALIVTVGLGLESIALAAFFGLRSFNSVGDQINGVGVKLDNLVDELHRVSDNLSSKLDRVVENTAAVNAKIDTLIAVLPKQQNQ
ncbi:MAG: hypothetical protein OXL97_00540 [Chloroflexota bacterium]|nr:hypothetical protein [Chloroflexota bacterium]MDE2886511.1 hypothetical protein [Chloroflexota bacterium]